MALFHWSLSKYSSSLQPSTGTGSTQRLWQPTGSLRCEGIAGYDMHQEWSRGAQASSGPKVYQLSDLGCISPDGDGQPTRTLVLYQRALLQSSSSRKGVGLVRTFSPELGPSRVRWWIAMMLYAHNSATKDKLLTVIPSGHYFLSILTQAVTQQQRALLMEPGTLCSGGPPLLSFQQKEHECPTCSLAWRRPGRAGILPPNTSL